MPGRSVSGYVDETVAARLVALARAEARTPASLVGQATSFFIGLPEVARSALRRIDHQATAAERRWLEGELVRLLLRADFSVTQRQLADDMGETRPGLDSEADLEAEALRWTDPAEL